MKLKTWNDISLSQFYGVQDLLAETDDYTTFNLLDLLYGIDSANMKLTELSQYNNALNFLDENVPTVNLKDKYEINGTVYNSNFNLTVVTAAQFIDYQNYIKTNKFEDFLSVFFIPDGHTYNDGYDMNKVKEDLLSLDFPTVKSITFFFTLQFEAFVTHFLSSLTKSVKKMKLPKEQEKKILDQIKETDLISLESFLSSLPTAKKQMKH